MRKKTLLYLVSNSSGQYIGEKRDLFRCIKNHVFIIFMCYNGPNLEMCKDPPCSRKAKLHNIYVKHEEMSLSKVCEVGGLSCFRVEATGFH